MFKPLIFLTAALAALPALANNSTMTCRDTNTSARPYYSFSFTFNAQNPHEADQASIDVLRSAFFGSEEVVRPQAVRGCQDTMVVSYEDELYVECGGDGDGGYASLRLRRGRAVSTGQFKFPEGKDLSTRTHRDPRIPEDTTFNLVCSVVRAE